MDRQTEARRRVHTLVHKPYMGTPVEGRLLLDAGPSERGWHLLMSGLRCPQLRAYTELLKIRWRWSDALTRGALLHMGLAHYYRRLQAVQEGDDPDQWHDPITAIQVTAARGDADPTRNPRSASYLKWVDPVLAMLQTYERHHRIECGAERVLAVEQPFHALVQAFDGQQSWSRDPAVREWLFSQRGDLVVYDTETGLIWIEDHKSTARIDPRQLRAYARSGQFQGYYNFGQRLLGDLFGGVRINLCVLPSGKQKAKVRRIVVPYLPHRASSFLSTIRWGERLWEDAQRLSPDPWSYPKVGIDNGGCEHRYGACEGADLCDHGPSYREAFEGDDDAYARSRSWVDEDPR